MGPPHTEPHAKGASIAHARGAAASPLKHWFAKQTIGSLLDARAKRDGTREALVFEGRRTSFAELIRDVDMLARGLIQLGIAPGDKVSLWMMNRPEWIHAALAVMRIGAVLVPINTRFRSEDAAYVLGQSDSTTLIIAARSGPIDYLGMARTLLTSLGSDREVVATSNLPALQRLIVLTLLMQGPRQCGHRLIKIGVQFQAALQRLLCRFPIGSFESCFSEQERNQVHARIVFLHRSQQRPLTIKVAAFAGVHSVQESIEVQNLVLRVGQTSS